MSKVSTETAPKGLKILIMGLDNSGKTSIILSLTKNTNLLSYYSLKPTAGAQIMNIEEGNTKYNIWELGGQEQYRKDYIKDMDRYFHEADRFIYVIDIQDNSRFDGALDYLKTIIQSIPKNLNLADFSIFLHKYDPNLELQSSFSKTVAANLIAQIKKIVPAKLNFKLYKTSIYTVFKKDLLS
jgi:small GTP-binding protein